MTNAHHDAKNIIAVARILSAHAQEMGSHRIGDLPPAHGSERHLSCCSNPCMPKFTSFGFAFALVIGSIASLPSVCAEGPDGSVAAESRDGSCCADRYNALLGQAKASLVKGDRGAAINSLIAAKIQLRTCEKLEERNSTVAVAVALNCAQSGRIE
jgi:hypothetical protein